MHIKVHQNRHRYEQSETFRFWAGQGSALSAGPQVADRARRPAPVLASAACLRARPVCSGACFCSQSELLSM